MLQFDGGQAATTDAFPAWPLGGGMVVPGLTPLAVLGPTQQGTGVLLSIYNNLCDVQLAHRDREGGGGIGWQEGVIIQGMTPGQFVFPKAIGVRARSHNAGQVSQIISQVWEIQDGPLPQTPLSTNLAFLSPGGVVGGGSGGLTGDLVWSAAVSRAGSVACDGSHYNSVADPSFANLFGVLGLTYGGTGNFDFAVPDVQGRALFMRGSNTDVDTFGKNDTSPLAQRSPGHNHSVVDAGHNHGPGSLVAPNALILGSTLSYQAGPFAMDQLNLGIVGATAAAATGIAVGPGGPRLFDTVPFMVENCFIVK